MKFIWIPTQMRIFQLLPHYQSLKSRSEQDTKFWREVVIALVNNKHNTETSRNGYPIIMFQEGPPHELFFIAINNWEQVIINPNKKTVATYVVRELEVLIWFMRTWMLKKRSCYNNCLLDTAWTRIKGNDNMISYTVIISVNISCSKYNNLARFSCFITHFSHI